MPYCRHFAELAVDRIEQVLYLLLAKRHALEPTLCGTQPPQPAARRRQRHPNLVATAARVCLLLRVLSTPAFERGIEQAHNIAVSLVSEVLENVHDSRCVLSVGENATAGEAT